MFCLFMKHNIFAVKHFSKTSLHQYAVTTKLEAIVVSNYDPCTWNEKIPHHRLDTVIDRDQIIIDLRSGTQTKHGCNTDQHHNDH